MSPPSQWKGTWTGGPVKSLLTLKFCEVIKAVLSSGGSLDAGLLGLLVLISKRVAKTTFERWIKVEVG